MPNPTNLEAPRKRYTLMEVAALRHSTALLNHDTYTENEKAQLRRTARPAQASSYRIYLILLVLLALLVFVFRQHACAPPSASRPQTALNNTKCYEFCQRIVLAFCSEGRACATRHRRTGIQPGRDIGLSLRGVGAARFYRVASTL